MFRVKYFIQVIDFRENIKVNLLKRNKTKTIAIPKQNFFPFNQVSLFFIKFYFQAITFNSNIGQTVSRIIPLRNAGNITLKLEPKITSSSGQFSVHPTFLTIKPGGESELKVSFMSDHPVSTERYLHCFIIIFIFII